MIEREPFIIRNGLRIFSVVVVVGRLALSVVGVRFQIENAEAENEQRWNQTRTPNAVELKAACDFFGGQYLGMPVVAPGGGAPGLMEVCNLGGTAQAGWQCEHFDGAYSRGSCSVDVGATLQAMSRVPG